MVETTERIKVIVETFQRGAGNFKIVQKNVNALQTRFNSFGKVMGADIGLWKEFNKAGGKFNTVGARLGNNVRKMTHGFRGFKMEMLGVMFFGMGIQKFFSGLLRPALEAAGVFKLWSTVLQVLFLPIVLKMLPYILKVADWIMNWSENTKVLVGRIVIWGAVLGGALFLVGMFALGIGSLIIVMSGLFNIIEKIIPNFSLAGVELSSFIEMGLMIGLVAKAADFLKKVFNDILDRLFEMDMIQDVFERLGISIDKSITPWENLKIAVKKAWDEIKKELNLDTEFGSIDTWITDINEQSNTWLDNMTLKLEELGMGDLVKSMEGLGTSVSDALPDIETLAKSLKIIADAITKITNVLGYIPEFFGPIRALKKGSDEWASSMGPQGTTLTSSPSEQVTVGGGTISPGGTTYNPTYNISITDFPEFERVLREHDARMIDQLNMTAGG